MSENKRMDNRYAIIGDIHSNYDSLVLLLSKIGFKIENMKLVNSINRKVIFVGDLIDRGDKPVETLKLVMGMLLEDQALAVCGNHDEKLLRALKGNKVKVNDDLAYTLNEINKAGLMFKKQVIDFLYNLPLWLSLDNDRLFVVHGGMKAELQGIESKKARTFALYGDITGEFDENGYPIRRDWAKKYKGKRCVVYGHQVIDEPRWINNTINVDTGCFKTGILSLVLYPEREVVQINS